MRIRLVVTWLCALAAMLMGVANLAAQANEGR